MEVRGKHTSGIGTSCLVKVQALESDCRGDAGDNAASKDRQQRKTFPAVQLHAHQSRERQQEHNNIATEDENCLIHENGVRRHCWEAELGAIGRHEEDDVICVLGRVALERSEESSGDSKQRKEDQKSHSGVLNVCCGKGSMLMRQNLESPCLEVILTDREDSSKKE